MTALATLALAAALAAPADGAGARRDTASATGPREAPAEALAAPAPPDVPLDWGRTSLAAAVGMPTHFAATAAVLAFACSGEVIGARCGRGIDGANGARAATGLLLATLPPLASGAAVWALGDDDDAPSSLPWTLAGGAAGQLLGFGLAMAADSPALAVLSLTVFPVAGEVTGLLLTREPGAATPALAPAPPLRAAGDAWLVPLASATF